MENVKRIDIYIIAIAIVLAGYFWWNNAQTFGAAPQGLPATIGAATSVTVGTSTPMTLTATSTGCASRIITTGAQAIKISFDWKLASTSLDKNIGHLQLGSTTVAYDSGLYGCSVVTARGIYQGGDVAGSNSSSTVTISTSY
jgi:hypothetical protein